MKYQLLSVTPTESGDFIRVLKIPNRLDIISGHRKETIILTPRDIEVKPWIKEKEGEIRFVRHKTQWHYLDLIENKLTGIVQNPRFKFWLNTNYENWENNVLNEWKKLENRVSEIKSELSKIKKNLRNWKNEDLDEFIEKYSDEFDDETWDYVTDIEILQEELNEREPKLYEDNEDEQYMNIEVFKRKYKITPLVKTNIEKVENDFKKNNEVEEIVKLKSEINPKEVYVLLPSVLGEDFKYSFEIFGFSTIWSSDFETLKKMISKSKISIAFEWQFGREDYTIRDTLKEQNKQVPIILCLNWNGEVPDNLNELGYADYIEVPFKANRIRQLVNEYITI